MTSRAESRLEMSPERQLILINADLDALDLATTQVIDRQEKHETKLARNSGLLLAASVAFSASAIAFALGFLR